MDDIMSMEAKVNIVFTIFDPKETIGLKHVEIWNKLFRHKVKHFNGQKSVIHDIYQQIANTRGDLDYVDVIEGGLRSKDGSRLVLTSVTPADFPGFVLYNRPTVPNGSLFTIGEMIHIAKDVKAKVEEFLGYKITMKVELHVAGLN
jgi:hypothetical protein